MALLDLATGTLVAEPAEIATLLEPTADGAALAAAAGGNAGPIAIRFPAFGDGRGISLAVLLRERHGFKGEIRAVGYLIPDLAQFLLRSGFDTAEITDPEQAAIWKACRGALSSTIISGAIRNPLPLRRDADAQRSRSRSTSGWRRVKSLTDRIREMQAADRRPHRLLHQSRARGSGDPARRRRVRRRDRRVHAGYRAPVPRSARDGRAVGACATASALGWSRRTPQEVEELVARDGVFGFRHSVENRKSCCEIRKVRPLNRELKGAQGWISGLAARALRRARERAFSPRGTRRMR